MPRELKTKAERTKHRRWLVDYWRKRYDGKFEDMAEDELTRLCRDKGVLLWDDETNDDEKLKDACREADIELVEDREIDFDPGCPIVALAVEAAFNPRFTQAAEALRTLRTELLARNVSSRAVLDLFAQGV